MYCRTIIIAVRCSSKIKQFRSLFSLNSLISRTVQSKGSSSKSMGALTKKKIKFASYIGIQKGAVAKSYMRQGFPIYEEMRKFLVIYEMAVSYI
jgi:hypothetical protein